MPGTSTYPGGLDSLNTSHTDNVNEIIHAQDIDDLADAVNKIEAAIGANPAQGNLPAGLYATLVARLNAIDTPGIKSVVPPYTCVITDMGVIINCNNTTAAALTIPRNSSVPFPIGTTLTFRAGAAGTITFTPDTGVTLQSRGGVLNSAGQFAMISALKTATDTWTLAGDLA